MAETYSLPTDRREPDVNPPFSSNPDQQSIPSEQELDCDTSQVTPPSCCSANHRLPLRRSIGTYNLFILLFGSTITILALTYLIFLWAYNDSASGSAQAPHLWRKILLNGWATLSVTLTALILRVTSASQAGICTAIVAALVLERRRFPLSQAARISITTANTNSEPRSLLWVFLSTGLHHLTKKVEGILLVLLAVTSIGLQFSSTLLISDFALGTLVRYPERTLLNLGLSSTGFLSLRTGSRGTQGLTMALFAEESISVDQQPNQFGVTDTGLKRRALLPFNKEERVRLQSFDGPLYSVFSRTRCMKPSLSATARLLTIDGYVEGYPVLEASLDYNQTYTDAGLDRPDLCYTKKWDDGDGGDLSFCLPEVFNCTLPKRPEGEPAAWMPVLCNIPNRSYHGSTGYSIPYWNDHEQDPLEPSSGSWAQLAIVSNMPYSFWENFTENQSLPTPIPFGEWSTYELQPGQFLNISLCMTGLDAGLSHLSVTGTTEQSEPADQWNSHTYTIKTGSLQKLLGADLSNKTVHQRGALEIINNTQAPASSKLFEVDNDSNQDAIGASWSVVLEEVATDFSLYQTGGSSVLCTDCIVKGYDVAADIAAVFQDIIRSSSRVALAIESFFFLKVRAAYYDFLPALDLPGYANTTFTTQTPLPTDWRGLTTVVVFATVNLVTAWAIILYYSMYGKQIMIQNFWQSASLLVSKDTMSVLRQGRQATDDEIAKQLEGDDPLVHLECCCEGVSLSFSDSQSLGDVEDRRDHERVE